MEKQAPLLILASLYCRERPVRTGRADKFLLKAKRNKSLRQSLGALGSRPSHIKKQ